MSALGGRPLVLSDYRRIAGSPIQSTYDLLHEFYAVGAGDRGRRHPRHRVRQPHHRQGARPVLRERVQGHRPHDRRASTRRSARFSRSAAKARSTSGWRARSIVDYDRSGECAAGTGSFLDQQALRMQYSVEEVGERGLHGELRARASPAAARCSPRAT